VLPKVDLADVMTLKLVLQIQSNLAALGRGSNKYANGCRRLAHGPIVDVRLRPLGRCRPGCRATADGNNLGCSGPGGQLTGLALGKIESRPARGDVTPRMVQVAVCFEWLIGMSAAQAAAVRQGYASLQALGCVRGSLKSRRTSLGWDWPGRRESGAQTASYVKLFNPPANFAFCGRLRRDAATTNLGELWQRRLERHSFGCQ
jgi:hypothetical protein